MISNLLNEKERELLKLDVRKRIYIIVKKFAGCHFREIERKSKLSTGSVNYHLNHLIKYGLIKQEKLDNNILFFPQSFKGNTKLLGLLRKESIRKIILFILINENCNHKQIVRFVGLTPSTVSWHLKRLVKNKIIETFKKKREKKYKLLLKREEIILLLNSYRDSFLDPLIDQIIKKKK